MTLRERPRFERIAVSGHTGVRCSHTSSLDCANASAAVVGMSTLRPLRSDQIAASCAPDTPRATGTSLRARKESLRHAAHRPVCRGWPVPRGLLFAVRRGTSALMDPGTNNHHTKSLTLIWGETDIRTALAAGGLSDFSVIFLKIFNLSHLLLDLAPGQRDRAEDIC